MNQGLPVAGKEVGLMYSFSSQSDDGFSAADAAARDLTRRQNERLVRTVSGATGTGTQDNTASIAALPSPETCAKPKYLHKKWIILTPTF